MRPSCFRTPYSRFLKPLFPVCHARPRGHQTQAGKLHLAVAPGTRLSREPRRTACWRKATVPKSVTRSIFKLVDRQAQPQGGPRRTNCVRSQALYSPGMTCIQRMRNVVLIVPCYDLLGRQQCSLPALLPEIWHRYSELPHGPCSHGYRFVTERLKHRAERSRREEGWCKRKERGISPLQATDLSCLFPFWRIRWFYVAFPRSSRQSFLLTREKADGCESNTPHQAKSRATTSARGGRVGG